MATPRWNAVGRLDIGLRCCNFQPITLCIGFLVQLEVGTRCTCQEREPEIESKTTTATPVRQEAHRKCRQLNCFSNLANPRNPRGKRPRRTCWHFRSAAACRSERHRATSLKAWALRRELEGVRTAETVIHSKHSRQGGSYMGVFENSRILIIRTPK